MHKTATGHVTKRFNARLPQEYEEFRRIATHLAWLNARRHLFVRFLVYEETPIEDFLLVSVSCRRH